jgi:hypothetical protein
MPKMQEHFPAIAMDGRYAGNAGAFSGDGHGWPVCRKCRSIFRQLSAMDGRYAENAGAFFGSFRSLFAASAPAAFSTMIPS